MAAGVGRGGGGGGGYGIFSDCGGVGSDLYGSIQSRSVSSSSPPADLASASSQPFFISGSSSSFRGVGGGSMMSFEDMSVGKQTDRSFLCTFDWDENVDMDEYDDYFQLPEKKRRLTAEQVRFLERSFETENKLEPEKKVQLAKDLGLQPRQVAIWFQNRKARWKNKQLEKDFGILQTSFNSLKADYENLLKEKDQLNAEVVHLSDQLHLKEKGEVPGEVDTSGSEYQFQTSSQVPPAPVVIDSGSEAESIRRQQQWLPAFVAPSVPNDHHLALASPRETLDPRFPSYVDPCRHLVTGMMSSDHLASNSYLPDPSIRPDCSDDEIIKNEFHLGSEGISNMPSSSYKNNNSSSSVVDAETDKDVDYHVEDGSLFGIVIREKIGKEEEGDDCQRCPWVWSY